MSFVQLSEESVSAILAQVQCTIIKSTLEGVHHHGERRMPTSAFVASS